MGILQEYNLTEAQVMMTLSALAYADALPLVGESLPQQQIRIGKKLAEELINPTYATGNQWELAWGPGLSNSNMMYVAKNLITNQYAVVIRGTNWLFLGDWIEDLEVLKLTPFHYTHSSDPQIEIAQGSMLGLNDLISLTGNAPAMSPGPDVSLLQFLTKVVMPLQPGSSIVVTGHSLGGSLATVLAAWLSYNSAQWSSSLDLSVYTYAAPTAGNSDFAIYYDTLFSSNAVRIYNDLDCVANAWQNLEAIKTIYMPQLPCGETITGLVDLGNFWVKNNNYKQPTNNQRLSGKFNPSYSKDFKEQVGHQHDHNTYLALLGAPPIDVIAATLRLGRERIAKLNSATL